MAKPSAIKKVHGTRVLPKGPMGVGKPNFSPGHPAKGGGGGGKGAHGGHKGAMDKGKPGRRQVGGAQQRAVAGKKGGFSRNKGGGFREVAAQLADLDRFGGDSDSEGEGDGGAAAARQQALAFAQALRQAGPADAAASGLGGGGVGDDNDDVDVGSASNVGPATKKAAKAAAKAPSGKAVSVERYRRENNISSRTGDMRGWPAPFQTLQQLPFDPKIISVMRTTGFTAPSPIQAQSWPLVLTGKDLVAVAKTGSGKTLGYLLPLFHLLQQKGEQVQKAAAFRLPSVLVLAPTRELAIQIHGEAEKFGACVGIRACVVYGGASKLPQLEELKRGPNVLVATPGRLREFVETEATSVRCVSHVVLDEADRMLEMGFQEEIAELMEKVSTPHQTVCYTATWPRSVEKEALKYVAADAPHLTLNVANQAAATHTIAQEFHQLDRDEEKVAKLHSMLAGKHRGMKMLIFANTKRRCEAVAEGLDDLGVKCSAIHGDKLQADREQILEEFTEGGVNVMVATEVAARGLHIPGVTHVVNYDMPMDIQSYTHRIGRTGRAGATGLAVTFWNPAYDAKSAHELVKVAQAAGATIPKWLKRFASESQEVEDNSKMAKKQRKEERRALRRAQAGEATTEATLLARRGYPALPTR